MESALKNKIAARLRPEFRGSFRDDRGQFVIKEFSAQQIGGDALNRLKEVFKRRMRPIYPLLIKLISPVYDRDPVPEFIEAAPKDAFIVNLGSGTHAYRGAVNVDGVGYSNVHVVGDLCELPFEDRSVDRIVSVAVLEHVRDPARHVAEFLRVLKPGGELLVWVPFLQPFHASPDDYQRYTDAGVRELFRGFEEQRVRVGGGPTSALVWLLQEWLALVFSFGSVRLYRLLVPVMWVLSPLKYLDLLIARHPAARVAASGFYLFGRKPAL